MDLDELQSVQSRERQTDSLQQLRESFYRDAGEYIENLREERERAAERADDPWNSPEINRLSDDIDTAENTVEAIYERRVGKVVKMASLAAADMPTDDEGLTAEERDLFETLVSAIEANREHVVALLDGEEPAPVSSTDADDRPTEPTPSGGPKDPTPSEGSNDPTPSDRSTERGTPGSATPTSDGGETPDPSATDEPAPQDVDAADLMGGSEGEAAGGAATEANPSAERDAATTEPAAESGTTGPAGDAMPGDVTTDDGTADDGTAGGATTGSRSSESPTADQGIDEQSGTDADGADVDRTTVRITADVGEIYGVDERSYDLTAEDVVTLPAANADPLVERDAAERLD